ncbi:PEPxxWA-CTERM sorting domain-containing protein [Sphingomonas sp.]|jgi:hypothetical protein|uniref:PEPxxWA-CTERM sorting domain-containing protein n=1 Tax=Sphingomonas sp. TaxID=28214 RepID=UPI002DE325F8|nr:PEPxxWA-CTERM sorting domain-containing protein [Sphingomonas sp.]
MKRYTAAFAALSALTAPAYGNLLTNGSFEARAVTAADNCLGFAWCVRSFASTPGWTQYANGVDLIHNKYEQPGLPVLVDASHGVQFLDMNQEGAIGGLAQIVAATAGQTYTLSLDASAWATNSRGGTIGYDLYDPSSNLVLATGGFTDPAGGTWVRRTLNAQAASNQIGVRVYSVFAAQAGMGLDNVVLNAAVPEPATWAMMIGGFGLMGFTARRHARRSVAYA